MNETVGKQGAPTVTGVVYGFHEDANFKYLDVKITAGPWAVTDTIVGATNSTTAQISAIENDCIIDLKGEFNKDIPFRDILRMRQQHQHHSLELKRQPQIILVVLLLLIQKLCQVIRRILLFIQSLLENTPEVSKFAGLDINVGDKLLLLDILVMESYY